MGECGCGLLLRVSVWKNLARAHFSKFPNHTSSSFRNISAISPWKRQVNYYCTGNKFFLCRKRQAFNLAGFSSFCGQTTLSQSAKRGARDLLDIRTNRSLSSVSHLATPEVRNLNQINKTDLELKMDNLPKTFEGSGSFEAFLKNIDAVMFDCDGVLWVGMKVLPNAPDLVKKLRYLGKKVFFMTNNSTKTRDEFLVKFNTLGFEATLDEIVSTSFLAALHLKEISFDKKAYVIGTAGVTKELQAVNIKSLPIGPDIVASDMITWAADHLETMSLDADVGAVIVGFDHHFSYSKLFKAASYLKDPNCIFIATNTDESFPTGNNMVIPGTGSIVNSVKTAAQREPVVMGKPSRIPFDYVRRFHSLDSNRVLMVGDRANTDILFGTNCGLHTLLVLSGVTTLQEVKEWSVNGNETEKRCIPEYYAEDTGELYRLVENIPV